MKAFVPELTTVKPITVLTITSHGDPNVAAEQQMKSLYGTAYTLKMKVYKPKGVKMDIGPLIGRWPDAHLKPKSEWTGIWGLVIPDYVKAKDVIQKNPDLPVKLEVWKYKDVAQILHLGGYAEEGPTVVQLHAFIKAQGYKLDGNSHEEVYLTRPNAKVVKTLIRYKIRH